MTITNTPKPASGTQTNTPRVVDYETWDTIATTWDTETRTWDEMGTTLTNTTLSSDPFFSSRTFPFLLALPFGQGGGMTNTPKPI